MSFEFIVTEVKGNVGLVRFNRPKALNALSPGLMSEAMDALETFDQDDGVGAMVVTGDQRAFAAGADIKEMANATVVEMGKSTFISSWDRLKRIRKPIIAAVSGFAFGGGCEFAMACDMIVASESAQFGQPEINLGIIPGAGGTQRLTRAIGKALAMEVILNDRRLTAEEAYRFGLVNQVVPKELYLEEALKLAQQIANRAPVAIQTAKEAINAVFDMDLDAGVAYERRLFYSLFATEDQKEGMDAFVNKRKANWKGK
ncbi:MAG: enoyl-CoA hydratase-related protein [Ardenticatenaceae bacterium]|nr:enoyl-CoA hydratase-related protein [Ardenticatenaceae bacterium]